MENTEKNNEELEQKPTSPFRLTRSASFLLPVITALLIGISISFALVSDFKEGLSPTLLYIFFAVILLYVGVSVADVIMRKGKEKKYIIIMGAIATLADIVFIIFYNVF